MRILVIEDDTTVAAHVAKGLREAGHAVDVVHDGKDGLYQSAAEPYELLVVDRMLPGVDGLTIIRTLRASDNAVPVLILSALGEVDDRVKGLRAGGDDYLVKPFAFAELLARVDALARRRSAAGSGAEGTPTRLEAGDISMDLLSRTVERAGRPIDLQPREFRLLEVLMRNAGQVVTRTMLLESVWDYHFDPQTNVIDVHISRLRRKLDSDSDRPFLETVRGAGYVLRPS